jgi:hypothetical protein
MGSPDAPAVVIVRPCVHEDDGGVSRVPQPRGVCERAGSKCGVEGSVSVIQQRSLSPRRRRAPAQQVDCSNCSICCSPNALFNLHKVFIPPSHPPHTPKPFRSRTKLKEQQDTLLFNPRLLPHHPVKSNRLPLH